MKCIFDKNNNKIYYENSDGNSGKREFDDNNNLVYCEDLKRICKIS